MNCEVYAYAEEYDSSSPNISRCWLVLSFAIDFIGSWMVQWVSIHSLFPLEDSGNRPSFKVNSWIKKASWLWGCALVGIHKCQSCSVEYLKLFGYVFTVSSLLFTCWRIVNLL